MKLDLWKCDRCGSSKENPPQLGLPSGWVTLTLSKKDEGRTSPGDTAKGTPVDKHFCEKCSAGFHGWLKQEGATLPVQCPDCMADLLIIHGVGDPQLKFVKHNV